MSEFLAYYESNVGHYMPVVATEQLDKEGIEYRDFTREDVESIPDAGFNSGTDALGGWLYKKGQGIRASWSKRYMMVRGEYLFYFHGPQSEKPVGVIPLENCDVVLPPDGAKSFTAKSFFKSNDGFEFEVVHLTRRVFQCYAATENERSMWTKMISDRTGRSSNGMGQDSHKYVKERVSVVAGRKAATIPADSDGTSNIALTSTVLKSKTPAFSIPDRYNANNSPLSSPAGKLTNVSTPFSNVDPFAPPPPPVNYAGGSTPGNPAIDASAVMAQRPVAISRASVRLPTTSSPAALIPGLPVDEDKLNISNLSISPVKPSFAGVISSKLESAVAFSKEKDQEAKRQAMEERAVLERDLQEKFRVQQEGRKREALARERNMSKQRLEAARVLEMRNPMTLSELFRDLMFFQNELLCEEPYADSPLQFPHLKGEWTENMMVAVYQRYCRVSGYMSLEEFCEFMEDFAVLKTHCPHDDSDEPLPEFQAQLDPVRLLTTIPRNLGFSRDMEKSLKLKTDDFCVNFAQFYQLLLRITNITYPDIYEDDSVLAFNKVLQEAVLPIYAWSQGHSKRGSSDPLVTEERIVLLLVTYAPNLWKVFLMYCQNYQAKIPQSTLLYPAHTKISEQVLFGFPFNAGAYFRKKKTASSGMYAAAVEELNAGDDGLPIDMDKMEVAYFMTEAGCVRFALDYGLAPHLVSKKEIREFVVELNRTKNLHIVKPVTKPKPPTVFFQKTQTTLRREHGAFTNIEKSNVEHPMYFGVSDAMRSPAQKNTSGSNTPSKLKMSGRAGLVSRGESFTADGNDGGGIKGGLGFSEFVELIAKIALIGMDNPNYNVLFPTPFSKVLAMLTVWGIADLKKLDEVKAIRVESLV